MLLIFFIRLSPASQQAVLLSQAHACSCVRAPCRFDHIFGNFRTAAGRVRRLDVIIAPHDEAAFCVLGWSGSRQYLRFLRQYAVDLGMHLNSHRCACWATDSLCCTGL